MFYVIQRQGNVGIPTIETAKYWRCFNGLLCAVVKLSFEMSSTIYTNRVIEFLLFKI